MAPDRAFDDGSVDDGAVDARSPAVIALHKSIGTLGWRCGWATGCIASGVAPDQVVLDLALVLHDQAASLERAAYTGEEGAIPSVIAPYDKLEADAAVIAIHETIEAWGWRKQWHLDDLAKGYPPEAVALALVRGLREQATALEREVWPDEPTRAAEALLREAFGDDVPPAEGGERFDDGEPFDDGTHAVTLAIFRFFEGMEAWEKEWNAARSSQYGWPPEAAARDLARVLREEVASLDRAATGDRD